MNSGTLIDGRYEIKSILGKGGFGEVYLVYDHVGDVPYAFKTPRAEFADNIRIAQRFRREAQVWLDLGSHPNIVAAFFVVSDGPRLFLAIEIVPADEAGRLHLGDHLQFGPITEDKSLFWAIQISRGMQHAYAHGLKSHRDIKPANILIRRGREALVTDLGLARILSSERDYAELNLATVMDEAQLNVATHAGQRLGTPSYMSPEQFRDSTLCDERSDIYSFGLVLYQMASGGQLPFDIRPPRSRAEMDSYFSEMQRWHEQVPIPHLQTPLFPIIAKCLEKEPHERYQTFSQLEEELEITLRHRFRTSVPVPAARESNARQLLGRGYSYVRLREYNRARDVFETILENEPMSEAARCGIAHLRVAQGRFESALAYMDKHGLPINSEVLALKGHACIALGFYSEAATIYEQLLQLDWRNTQAINDKGVAHHMLGDIEQALFCYDMGHSLQPDESICAINRAIALWQVQNVGADELHGTVGHLSGITPTALSVLGLIQELGGRTEEAKATYEQALAVSPETLPALIGMGNLLYKEGAFERAMENLEQAMHLVPNCAGIWMNLGLALSRMGEPERARHHLSVAVRLEPNSATAWYNRGAIELGMRDWSRAIRYLERSRSIEPQAAKTAYSLALAYHGSKFYDAAAESYSQARQLGVDTPFADYNMAVCAASLDLRVDRFRVLSSWLPPEAIHRSFLEKLRSGIATEVPPGPCMNPRPGVELFQALSPLRYGLLSKNERHVDLGIESCRRMARRSPNLIKSNFAAS